MAKTVHVVEYRGDFRGDPEKRELLHVPPGSPAFWKSL
jgi:hypothetical protein